MASPRADSNSTPICRCRVLYLGSSVPHITKDGLQGIQEPLRELYPDQGASGARGIDSWLSVWSNGLLLENVDENHKKVTRFFPIDSLHYCAAVRYVLVQPPNSSPNTTVPPRFLPLDSPFARNPNAQHPPLFAAILRRTTGIKVLECHAFICKREMAANALVKCCFHAYADASYAKQIDGGSKYSTLIKPGKAQSVLGEAASSIEKVEGWRTNTTPRTNGHHTNGNTNGDTLRSEDNGNTTGIDDISIYNGDENHKVWAGAEDYSASTLRSVRSMGGLRSARPRQIIAPAKTPPPPPLPIMDDDQSTLKKNKKLKNKNKNREEFLYGPPLPVHYNGVSSLMRPAMRGPHSVSGTMMRPVNDGTLMRPGPPHPHMNGYGPPPPPPHMVLVSGRPMPPPPRMAGTFSHRPKNMRGMPPPFLGPPPPMMTNTGRRPKHYQHQEEPIYMPSNSRPLSPGASYHPGNFPIDPYGHPMLPPQNGPYIPPQNGPYPPQNGQYGPQNGQYGPQNGQYGPPNGQYVPQNGQYSPSNGPYSPALEASTLQRPVSTSTAKKSKKSKKNSNPDMDDGTDSPFNTGIYRKKGHLNERAFSYSIRQEHRSRSYGSLASLKFSENGSPIKEDSKKEREIMQMMQDLELSGDELQHSPNGPGPAMNGGGYAGPAIAMNGGGGGFETRPRNAAAVGRR